MKLRMKLNLRKSKIMIRQPQLTMKPVLNGTLYIPLILMELSLRCFNGFEVPIIIGIGSVFFCGGRKDGRWMMER